MTNYEILHFTLFIFAAAFQAAASTSDFTATVVRNWNGREGVTFVRYDSKDSNKVYGSAFVFDLTPGPPRFRHSVFSVQ